MFRGGEGLNMGQIRKKYLVLGWALMAVPFMGYAEGHALSSAAVSVSPTVEKYQSALQQNFNKNLFLKRDTGEDYLIWTYLIKKVPLAKTIYEAIPERFSFAHNNVIWSPAQIVIEKEWIERKKHSDQHRSRIFFSYDDSSRALEEKLEVPLFYSIRSGLLNWERVPAGYYKFRVKSGSEVPDERSFNLRFETRF